MRALNARQLEQRARAIADQMRDPLTKHTMANLALSYELRAAYTPDAARAVSGHLPS